MKFRDVLDSIGSMDAAERRLLMRTLIDAEVNAARAALAAARGGNRRANPDTLEPSPTSKDRNLVSAIETFNARVRSLSDASMALDAAAVHLANVRGDGPLQGGSR